MLQTSTNITTITPITHMLSAHMYTPPGSRQGCTYVHGLYTYTAMCAHRHTHAQMNTNAPCHQQVFNEYIPCVHTPQPCSCNSVSTTLTYLCSHLYPYTCFVHMNTGPLIMVTRFVSSVCLPIHPYLHISHTHTHTLSLSLPQLFSYITAVSRDISPSLPSPPTPPH